ncbi:SMC-Scp complex subunit ScpB [Wenzhouxiangella sediminis]|uniref:SMC-Scp complex subunit ScpB n=1 Tax=Wenzhouxiangella sediminis TaxID=1792836 RepID=A0A3E1KBY7_9GAMM|nr:SMC-Scp complex subunit ScpB [Wenzhouxiangella sediminis]
MDIDYLKRIVEGALLAAGNPLSLNQLNSLFPDGEQPGHGPLREALAALDAEMEGRAVELREVGSGYRLQIRSQIMPIISQLWAEKPPRYSRALLETLAIIAYRQPITRGEIEQIRGVSVSSNILRTLQERDWIRVVGHRDVPGRPELIGTTKAFLDYFNLKSLDELPTLAEIKDIDNLEPELELQSPESESDSSKAEKDANAQVDQEQSDQEQSDAEETDPEAGEDDRAGEEDDEARQAHEPPGQPEDDGETGARAGEDESGERFEEQPEESEEQSEEQGSQAENEADATGEPTDDERPPH